MKHIEWPIRIGIGLMYLYSGSHMFKNPGAWAWAVPDWFSSLVIRFMPIETYLMAQGTAEFILGLLFLAWFIQQRVAKYLAILASVQITVILLFGNTGINPITFRDIGVLGGLLGLTAYYWAQDKTYMQKS